MKIVLLGRTKRNPTGGLARSARLIKESLERVGHTVDLRNVQAPVSALPPDTDIVWHYGDFEHLEQQAKETEKAGAAMLVNSAWDGTSASLVRCDTVAVILKDLRVHAGLVVFSHAATSRLHELLFHKVPVVALPKTIRSVPPKRIKWAQHQRFGVCIGDIEKLNRRRLLCMDPEEAVAALKAAGAEKIYAYNQYGTAETPQITGVEEVPMLSGESFVSWLGSLQLYVSLAAHETFAMVPCEAQSQGTPVLYFPQQQSHTEYFGFTGAAYSNAAELERLARRLNESEQLWNTMSAAGIENARARAADPVFLGAQLTMALERFMANRR